MGKTRPDRPQQWLLSKPEPPGPKQPARADTHEHPSQMRKEIRTSKRRRSVPAEDGCRPNGLHWICSAPDSRRGSLIFAGRYAPMNPAKTGALMSSNQNWQTSHHRQDANNQSYSLWYHTLVRSAIQGYGFKMHTHSDQEYYHFLIALGRRIQKDEDPTESE